MMLKPGSKSTHQRLFHRTRTGITVIILWTILTAWLVVFSSISLNYPYWLENSRAESIGIDKKCTISSKCDDGLLQFSMVLTGWWKLVAVMILTATVIFSACPLVLFIWLYVCSRNAKRGFLITGCIQAVGAILLIVGCLLFPLGWQSQPFRDVCGNTAAVYDCGECHIGWAFVLAMLSAFDAVILSGVMFCMMQKTFVDTFKERLLTNDFWVGTSES